MQKLLSVMAVLCLFLMNSCADFEDESNQNEKLANQVKVTKDNLSDFVQAQVEPTTTPEKYMVYFGWPRLETGVRLRIRKGEVLAVVSPNQTTFSQEVDHNQNLTYTFDLLESNNSIIKSFSKLVTIPRDFVVKKDQSEFLEDTILNVQRFFISNVPLITNGFSVEINTSEFHSEKGLIETFPANSQAGFSSNDVTLKNIDGIDGKSGGKILIKSNAATGELNIFMRGQHGGDGHKGESYPYRAADGSPPGTGSIECDGGHGRFSAEQFQIFTTNPILILACSCLIEGYHGGNGSNGAKGRQGGRAGNGGSSGSLKIEIKDASAFVLSTHKDPGLAGKPGEGGNGQPGGIAQGQKTKCSGNVGRNGASGEKGDVGESGLDGKDSLICIYLESEEKNDCY